MQSEAGSLLIEGGLVTEPQLKQALGASVRAGGSLVQNLVRLGYVADTQLASFFASRLQIPLAESDQFENLPAFITRLIPTDVVMTHRTVPLMLHQGVLHVAMSDPTDRAALEEISFITGYSASPVAAPDPLVEAAMARYYGIPPDDSIPELDSLPDSDPGETTGRYSIITRRWTPAGAADSRPPSGTFDQAPPIEPIEQPQQPSAAAPEPTETPPPAAPEPTETPAQAEAPSPPAEPEPLVQPPATITPPAAPAPMPADPSAVVVEPATGELAELFGLGKPDSEVIELTKPKPAKAAASITDAIRLQVDRETADPQAIAEEDEPARVTADEVESLWSEPASASEDETEANAPAAEPINPPEPDQDAPRPAGAPAPAEEPDSGSAFSIGPADSAQAVQGADEATRVAGRVTADPDPQELADSPVGEVLEPLRDADEARYLIAQASDRDEVARTLVRYAHAFIPRVALFIVKKDILVGWLGAGKGINLRQVKGIMIPLSSPSVFRTVRETGTDYFGTLPRTTVNDIFLAALGDVRPRQALLIPVTVRHKPICILYGDCGSEAGFAHDLSGIHLISQDASNAFEQLILQRKMNRLVKR